METQSYQPTQMQNEIPLPFCLQQREVWHHTRHHTTITISNQKI